MKHFRNLQNEIYAYELDGSQDHLITADMVAITVSERDALISANVPALTAAELLAENDAELMLIDIQSIRSIREYIAGKPDAPQILKDREAEAVAKRAER